VLLSDIRKALESPLYGAMAAASPVILVQWENQSIITDKPNPTTGLPITEYIRFSFHPTLTDAATLGQTPRIQKDGFIKTDIFIQSGAGTDRADAIFELIKAAYPVTSDFTRNGSQVQIGAIADNPGVAFGSWYYKPVSIPWTVWNANG